MESDPIGLGGGLNTYLYVDGNPIISYDPDGKNLVTAFGGLLQETFNSIKGDGFDYCNVYGALKDGYNGEGAGLLWALGEDVLTLGTLGVGGYINGGARGIYYVYQGIDAFGVVRYIGITMREPAIRWAEHKGEKEFLRYSVVKSGLDKQAARIMEQKLINLHGSMKNGGNLLNRYNSIAEKCWEELGI